MINGSPLADKSENRICRQSTKCANTSYPIWYETLLIPEIGLPSKLSLTPDIRIAVYDGASSTGSSTGTLIGESRFPVELATGKLWPYKARPRWLRLVRHDYSAQRFDASSLDQVSVLAHQKRSGEDDLPPGDYFAGEILLKLEVVPLALRDNKSLPNSSRVGSNQPTSTGPKNGRNGDPGTIIDGQLLHPQRCYLLLQVSEISSRRMEKERHLTIRLLKSLFQVSQT